MLSVQFICSVVSDSLQHNRAHHATLSITISQSLLKLMPIDSVMSSNHLILFYPLLLLLSVFPSIRVFSNESVLHIRWPQYWSISPILISSTVLEHWSTASSASVLAMNIQDWFLLGLTGLISLQLKGLSRIFSHTTVQKHQFYDAQLVLWSNFHIHTWLLEKS